MSRLHRREGLIGVEMTDEEVAELRAAGETVERFQSETMKWVKRFYNAGKAPALHATYRIWSAARS